MQTEQTAAISDFGKKETTNWLLVILLWLCGVFSAIQFAKFSITYEHLLAHYASGPGAIGIALSIVGFVGLLFGATAGVVANRVGFKKVLIYSLFLGTTLSIVQAQTPPLPILVLSRILEGASHLGIVVAAPTLIVMNSAKSHQAITMGLWGTFFGVGYAVAGWVGVDLIEQFGFQSLYTAHALSLFVCIGLVSLAVSGTSTDSKGFSLLKFLAQLPKDLKEIYSNPKTCFPAIIFLFHALMFVALLTFLPRVSDEKKVTDFLMIVLPLTSMIGTLLAGFIAQYFISPKTLAKLSFLGIAIFISATHWFTETSSILQLLCMCTLFCSGLLQGASFALIPYMTNDESEQSNSIGAVAQLGNLGSTVGAPLIAILFEKYTTMGLAASVVILCIVGTWCAYLSRKY